MHLDEGTIHAWLDGALDADESRRAEEHVASCGTCAEAVAEARGMIAAASRILLALDDVPSGVIPGGAPAAPAASDPPPAVRLQDVRSRRRPWWASTQLRAAAAILVVAAGAWAAREAFVPGARHAEFSVVAADTAFVSGSGGAAPTTVSATSPAPAAPTTAPTPAPPSAPPAVAQSGEAKDARALPLTARAPRLAMRGNAAAKTAAPEALADAANSSIGRPQQLEAVVATGAGAAPLRRPAAIQLSETVVAGAESAAASDAAQGAAATDSASARLRQRAYAGVQRADSARRADINPEATLSGVDIAAEGAPSRARVAPRIRAVVPTGVREGAVPSAATAPPAAPSPQQVRETVAAVERSTPREIPGLRLLKHTVRQVERGRVHQGEERVDQVRYAHSLLYEVAPGSTVELLVVLPPVKRTGRSPARDEVMTRSDSMAVRRDGNSTSLRWREPDGTQLELSGRVSLAELESLRSKVRIPPRVEP